MPRTLIYRQDPSVTTTLPDGRVTPSVSIVNFPKPVPKGLSGEQIKVNNAENIGGNAQGDFFYTSGTDAFSKVHAYSVVLMVKQLTESVLKKIGALPQNNTLGWQWGSQPLSITVDAGQQANAFYTRVGRRLEFWHTPKTSTSSVLGSATNITTEQAERAKAIFLADSLDVVAHEAGHAELDAIKPGLLESRHPQSAAFHEAFGDIMALSLILSRAEMVQQLFLVSGGNLHKSTFLTNLAEQFGNQVLGLPGLRNADNDLTVANLTDIHGRIATEPHDLSQLFTGAYYDVLVDVYQAYRAENPVKPREQCLMETSHWMMCVLFKGILNAPVREVAFEDIIELMKKSVDTLGAASLLKDKSLFNLRMDDAFYTRRGIKGTREKQANQQLTGMELSMCLRAENVGTSATPVALNYESIKDMLSIKPAAPVLLSAYKRRREEVVMSPEQAERPLAKATRSGKPY